jgi:hypothetical protein
MAVILKMVKITKKFVLHFKVILHAYTKFKDFMLKRLGAIRKFVKNTYWQSEGKLGMTHGYIAKSVCL